MSNLFLDTAYFPGVSQAIQVARSVNAIGWSGYIFDPYLPNGNGGWTPDAVKGIMDAGLGFLPIYVPGNSPISPERTIEILHFYNFSNGPCVIDIEGGSDPGEAYVNNWCDVLKANGFLPIVYGLGSTVAQDANHASGIWIANYQYHGVVQNLDPFPPGFNTEWYKDARAWQYANSFNVDGVEVDASTSNLPLDFQGGKGVAPVAPNVPFWITTNPGAKWYDDLKPGQDVANIMGDANISAGKIIAVDSRPDHFYYKWDGGSWWLRDIDVTGVADPTPKPVVVVPAVDDDSQFVLKADFDLLKARVNALEQAAVKSHSHSGSVTVT